MHQIRSSCGHFNPTAPTTAKTLWSFDRSECNWVTALWDTHLHVFTVLYFRFNNCKFLVDCSLDLWYFVDSRRTNKKKMTKGKSPLLKKCWVSLADPAKRLIKISKLNLWKYVTFCVYNLWGWWEVVLYKETLSPLGEC